MPHEPEIEDQAPISSQEQLALIHATKTKEKESWVSYKVPEHLNDELKEIPNCCEQPHVHVVSAGLGCCRVIGCKNCEAVWKTTFADGHDMDNHPPRPKLSPEENNQMRAQRRRKRRNARKR